MSIAAARYFGLLREVRLEEDEAEGPPITTNAIGSTTPTNFRRQIDRRPRLRRLRQRPRLPAPPSAMSRKGDARGCTGCPARPGTSAGPFRRWCTSWYSVIRSSRHARPLGGACWRQTRRRRPRRRLTERLAESAYPPPGARCGLARARSPAWSWGGRGADGRRDRHRSGQAVRHQPIPGAARVPHVVSGAASPRRGARSAGTVLAQHTESEPPPRGPRTSSRGTASSRWGRGSTTWTLRRERLPVRTGRT
jgi:hypothetical protein